MAFLKDSASSSSAADQRTVCALWSTGCQPHPPPQGGDPARFGRGCLLTCESVHERGQRAIEHLEEGISARVFARAAQDGVLQHVRDAGAVHGRGAELHAARDKRSKPKAQAEGTATAMTARMTIRTTQPLTNTVSDDNLENH